MNAFIETNTYTLGPKRDPYMIIMIVIQVKALHHLACVEVTVETIEKDDDGKLQTEYDRHLIGERLTLKYF
jgi:hypothetical protein